MIPKVTQRIEYGPSRALATARHARVALRHGSVSGTLGWSELARARWAGQGDFLFAYGGVACANMDHGNVSGRSRANPRSRGPFRVHLSGRPSRRLTHASNASFTFVSAISNSRSFRARTMRSASLPRTGTGMVYSTSRVSSVPSSTESTEYANVTWIIPMD